MKTAALLIVLATPMAAQDYAQRGTDTVPTHDELSALILDRELEYFDGGISRYASDGSYAWTYTAANGGATIPGTHEILENATVCITYDAGQTRCDRFVLSGERLVLLTDDGQRYPLREIR